jgi:hypothetical protein
MRGLIFALDLSLVPSARETTDASQASVSSAATRQIAARQKKVVLLTIERPIFQIT